MAPFPLLLSLALALPPAPGDPAPPGVFCIDGVRVEHADGTVLDPVRIVLRGGAIEAVGADVEIPYDAVVIDGAGLTAVAGFVDLFTTAFTAEPAAQDGSGEQGPTDEGRGWAMPRYARAGLTPERSVLDALALAEAKRKEHHAQGFTTVLAAPRPAGISGTSALVDLVDGPVPAALLAADVALHATLRPSGQGYPSTLMGVLAHDRQFFLDARHHEELWRHHREHGGVRPPVDPAYEALRPVLAGERPLAFEAEAVEDVRLVLAMAEEFGFRPWIVGGARAHEAATELAAAGAPLVLGLDFPEKPKGLIAIEDESKETVEPEEEPEKPVTPAAPPTDPSAPAPPAPAVPAAGKAKEEDVGRARGRKESTEEAEAPQRALRDQEEKRRARIAGAAALHAAGVPFAFTTRGVKTPQQFRENLALAIGAGLPRAAALAALTTVPARLCGLDGVIGEIAPGRLANLAVFDGDPFAQDSRVRYVFVRGHKVEFAAEKKQATERKADAAATPAAVDLTGTWGVEVRMGDSTREYVVELKQDATTLSGVAHATSGDGEVTGGSVADGAVRFVLVFDFGSRHYEFVFEGEVEDAGTMSGTGSINASTEFTWTGTRKDVRREAAR